MRIAAASVAVLAAVTLAACSSTSNGTPTSAPSTKATPSTSGPTGFPSSPSAPPASTPVTGALSEAQAEAALLTSAEIGNGFTQTQTDDTDTPLPCTPNDPPLSQQFPPAVNVQADFGGAAGKALFSEQIETFSDAATLAQVIAAGEQGLACGSATVNGTKFTIAGPTELTTQIPVPVDKAEAWSLTSTVLNAALVIVAVDDQLIVFSFSGDPSLKNSQLPDPPTLITSGVTKVKAALK